MTRSIVDDTSETLAADAVGPPEGPAGDGATTPARPPSLGLLRRDRKRLWEERQEALYHLGGLALDLHLRGRLDDDLVARRAEYVAAMDRRMAVLDDALRDADERRRRGRVRAPDPVGYCLSCGAPHLADAAFCSRCGSRIHIPEAESDTQVIPIETETQ